MTQEMPKDELGKRAEAFASAKAAFLDALNGTRDVDRLLMLVGEYGYTEEDISIAALRRVLALDPKHLRALTAKGHMAFMLGDNVEAYACYRRAEGIAPDDKEVLELKALLSLDWNDKIATYRHILDLYPDEELARDNLQRLEALSEEDRKRVPLAWPPGQHPPE